MAFSGNWQEEAKISEVRESEDGFDVSLDGTGFFLQKKWGVIPMVGDTVQLNTVGFSAIRGVRINGKQIFLQTDEDAENEHKERTAALQRKKREDFERDRPQMDADFEALPGHFQRRIQRLREKSPNFRWEFEPYDLFCCKEAVKLVKVFEGRPGALLDFGRAEPSEQKRLAPDLEFAEHSGNTFGASVQLAHMYLTHPTLVPYMHGALAPLVGCEGYGCHPLTPDEEREVQAAAPREAS